MLDNIKVIGFDLDGTLYPISSEIKKRQRTKIYEKISSKFDISLKKAKDIFEEHYSNFMSSVKTLEEISKQLGRKVEENIVQEALEEADFLDLIKKNEELNCMFLRLKKQRPLDLLTASSYDLSLAKLEKIGINLEIFDYFLSRNNGFRKTDGSLYKKWIKNREFSPEKMLYVGDNTKLDIDIPKSLGIKTCIIGNYKNADFEINNILDLEILFKGF